MENERSPGRLEPGRKTTLEGVGKEGVCVCRYGCGNIVLVGSVGGTHDGESNNTTVLCQTMSVQNGTDSQKINKNGDVKK